MSSNSSNNSNNINSNSNTKHDDNNTNDTAAILLTGLQGPGEFQYRHLC